MCVVFLEVNKNLFWFDSINQLLVIVSLVCYFLYVCIFVFLLFYVVKPFNALMLSVWRQKGHPDCIE